MNFPPVTTPRLPAEWEPQDAVLLAWPHVQTDWRPILDQVTKVYIELIRQISRFETVIVIAPELQIVRDAVKQAGIDHSRLILIQIDTNDTWTRDFGPITIYTGNKPQLLDFTFNGWGLKFPATKDNQATSQLYNTGRFSNALKTTIDFVLEGGSIETNGSGTMLTTSACLLNPNRNPHMDKKALELTLSQYFGCDHVLWLEHGWLAGDDTDSHIDTLARLCPDDVILYVRCNDSEDEHYSELKSMEQQLQTFKTPDGRPYQLVPLPWPHACYDDGDRLPASYANYLLINAAVLVPTYNDPADSQAINIIGKVFPDREIIGVDCRALIKQHGSLHCITMQIPQGVLA
ncbi:agmatine deiminase [Desulfuromusa kysingii]|uniref:Agmatine deiminase n=1 Tax=Desulfuromusa kysingii TaxID=37625 RepID=A0A1H3ZMS7_9BACT|nr:agmatine deiminase family protein [Desulfuromusa kysingii]SEA24958.1 agmatine deiminase [Desulfuromusa kysingii]